MWSVLERVLEIFSFFAQSWIKSGRQSSGILVLGRVLGRLSGSALESVFERVFGKVLETYLGNVRKSLWESAGKCFETGSEPVFQRVSGNFFDGVLCLNKVLGKVVGRLLGQARRQIRKEPTEESCKYY